MQRLYRKAGGLPSELELGGGVFQVLPGLEEARVRVGRHEHKDLAPARGAPPPLRRMRPHAVRLAARSAPPAMPARAQGRRPPRPYCAASKRSAVAAAAPASTASRV